MLEFFINIFSNFGHWFGYMKPDAFGDGDGEGWLYKYENELNPNNSGYHHYELFGQSRYL
jgi:hypothetical protein